MVSVEKLGDLDFRKEFKIKYPYLIGGMYKGISSREMVVAAANSGILSFLGTGGMKISDIERDIQFIQEQSGTEIYGMNFLYNPSHPEKEKQTMEVFLRYGISIIEASAFMEITESLVEFLANGIAFEHDGYVLKNKIIAKISRPEIAKEFVSPPPERLIKKLLSNKRITNEVADVLRHNPVAKAICVESDSGGHTDSGVAYAIFPVIREICNEIAFQNQFKTTVFVGAAGGIGTPTAAAAAFMLGADFIVTGSINQCTVEAGISDSVKDMLQDIDVQDTGYAPAGDMFEYGARVQVLKKSVFFPARANKLYEIYLQNKSLDDINSKTRQTLEERYFHRSFEDIFNELKLHYPVEYIHKAEINPKYKMALVFKWYFFYSTQLALKGDGENRVDYQVQCGSSLGAFNQWVKGSEMEKWRERNVVRIALKLLEETAVFLNTRRQELFS